MNTKGDGPYQDGGRLGDIPYPWLHSGVVLQSGSTRQYDENGGQRTLP